MVSHEHKPTEFYPEGKRLWLAVCEVRGVDAQRAEIEWQQWEEGFLTRGEWQRVAENFSDSIAKLACWCQTCRPLTISDMRMVRCPTCGDKWCPHATNHSNECSHEVQVPSRSISQPEAALALLKRIQVHALQHEIPQEWLAEAATVGVDAAVALLKRIRFHALRHALPRKWLTAADEVLGTWGSIATTHGEIFSTSLQAVEQ